MQTDSEARLIPLEDFFRKPDRAGFDLSPDGRWLAWLAPVEFAPEAGADGGQVRRMNLFVAEIESGAEGPRLGEARQVTRSAVRDVAGFLWGDGEHLVYVQDRGGDENWRLYRVRADGTDEAPLDLTPFENVQCQIVDDLEDCPGELLFQMNQRVPQVFDVYRLDLRTGEMRCVAENPGNVQAWMTDHQGRLRLATTTDGVNTSLLYRATEDEEWRTVATYDFKEQASPIGFMFDDAGVWVSSNLGRDKSAIYEFDPATGELGELVYEHADVDVAHLLRSRARKKAVGVAYETDRTHHDLWDARRAVLQSFVEGELPGRHNTLRSYSRDETRYVVHSGGDRTLGSYWLLDAPYDAAEESSTAGFRMTHLCDLAPWLDESRLAPMIPVTYPARDGLAIHGYLTLPAGRAQGDGGPALPLVVNPHGGPWVRDSWGYNPEVQFLASRGYAVLQMNYRGSTGYGRAFWEASFGQWGLAMQDDVTDGVRWACSHGVADPDRVAIYGGSYGGYATLAGVTKTPELYKCAIDYVGVSSLFTWLEAFPPYWEPFLEMVYEMVGHPERDEDRLRATSPLFHVDRIACPMLVAQGANDPRVKLEESEQIVAALREKGLDVEYLVKEDEGHGFQNEENRFEFYRAMERFLAAHL